MSIALLLMIRDEFKAVRDIIKAVEGICEEKIIVVTGDKRVKESGECKILYFPWHDDYSTPLNAGLRICRSKWVLRLDSDEEIDEIMDRFVEMFSDERLVDSYEELLDNLEDWQEKLATEGPEVVNEVKESILSSLILPENLKDAFIGDDKVPKHTGTDKEEPISG